MVSPINCITDIPVVFGTPTVTDDCDPDPGFEIKDNDVVTHNPDGSITHCRTWEATDESQNTSTCSQCITVVCGGTVNPTNEPIVQSSNVKSLFSVYPVPFKEDVTIRYDFDYKSNARIEILM